MASNNHKMTYEERCHWLAVGRAKLAAIRAASRPPGSDDDILRDLGNRNITYVQIAARHNAGLNRIVKLAKQHGLNRYRLKPNAEGGK